MRTECERVSVWRLEIRGKCVRFCLSWQHCGVDLYLALHLKVAWVTPRVWSGPPRPVNSRVRVGRKTQLLGLGGKDSGHCHPAAVLVWGHGRLTPWSASLGRPEGLNSELMNMESVLDPHKILYVCVCGGEVWLSVICSICTIFGVKWKLFNPQFILFTWYLIIGLRWDKKNQIKTRILKTVVTNSTSNGS